MFKAPSRTLLLVLVAGGLGCGAVPASAKTDNAGQNTTRMTIEHRNGKTLYCVTDTMTGSRLPVRTCKDRAEWAQDGLVIPERESRATDSAKQQPSG